MLSEKPWKLESVMLLVAGLFLSLSVGATLGMLLGFLYPAQSFADRKFYHFLISFFSFQGAAIVLAHYFLKQHQMTWMQLLGLRSPSLKTGLALAVLVTIIAVPMALLLNQLVAWLMSLVQMEAVEQPTVTVLKVSAGAGQRICFGITAILVAPLVEETLFRGILYPLIKQRGYPMLALSSTSLLFGAIHGNLMTFVPLTFFAMVLTWLYEKTDALIAPIVSHSLFNTANFVIFILYPH
jgi:membrane protease YdiL (CAAX protease family)